MTPLTVFALAAAFASAALIYFVLLVMAESIGRIHEARRSWRWAVPGGNPELGRIVSLWGLVPLALAVLVGFLTFGQAPLIGIYALAAGMAVTWYLRPKPAASLEEADDSLEAILPMVESQLHASRSLVGALEVGASEAKGPVKIILNEFIAHYRFHPAGLRERLAKLRATWPSSAITHFLFLLEKGSSSSTEAIREGLRDLRRGLERRRRMRARMRVSLALVRGEVRFLQVANVVVFCAALLVPFLRDFYISSLSRQLLFVVVATISLGTSLYIDREMEQLRREAL